MLQFPALVLTVLFAPCSAPLVLSVLKTLRLQVHSWCLQLPLCLLPHVATLPLHLRTTILERFCGVLVQGFFQAPLFRVSSSFIHCHV